MSKNELPTFHIFLMVTLCKSQTLKPSLTSHLTPIPSTLLTMYLVVNSGGRLSQVASIDMNTNNFLFKPKKQISDVCSRGHILSLPNLLLFTQKQLELFSLRKTPVFS